MINYFGYIPKDILNKWKDSFGEEYLQSASVENEPIVIIYANSFKDRFHPICWLARINVENMSIIYNPGYDAQNIK